MEELGLTHDSLKLVNTKLIMTSITLFGQTGPYRSYKAYGLNISHGAGAGYLTPVDSSEAELGPIKGGGFFGDYCNGLSAAAATMVALYSREMTGEGQHIDISEQEASIAYDRVEVGMFASDGFINTRVRTRGGMALLPCRDGDAPIAIGQDRHWKALVEVMGNPEWIEDERFKDEEGRTEHSQEMNSLIAEWTKTFFREEIYHKLASAGIAAGVVRSQSDLIKDDEQLRVRGFFVEIDHPEAGKLVYPSAPYRLSETPWRVERPAPTIGQHNEEVYSWLLGYTKEELVRLRESGII
jgi:crotonobetainyl-CoA:carnitine CoA-transferase CaiB-like acyl-CoA transferase